MAHLRKKDAIRFVQNEIKVIADSYIEHTKIRSQAVKPSFRSELMNLNSVIQRSFTAFSVTDVLTVIPRFDLLLLFNGRLLCLLLNLSSNASII